MASRYEVEVDISDERLPYHFSTAMIGHNKRVLEFGCAGGSVTRALAERGCRVVGIEVDATAAREAEAHAEEVLVLDLDVDDFVGKIGTDPFDVVTFLDVLEHLRDPLRVLRAACSLLAPEGYVVVSVPNMGHADVRFALVQGRFDYQEVGLLDRTHLRFFTPASLDEMLEQAGLVAVDRRRLLVPAFGSGIEVDRSALAQETIDEVLADPEAETFQYVVKAVRHDATSAVSGVLERCRELEDEFAAVQVGVAERLAAATARAENAEAVVTMLHERWLDAERRVHEQRELAEAGNVRIDRLDAELATANERIAALSVRGRFRRLAKPFRRAPHRRAR